jgi:hypothetical protein
MQGYANTMARSTKPPKKSRSLADLMSEDGAAYVGETHDPMSDAPPPPPETREPLLDERLDVSSLDGAIHVVNATLVAYSERRVNEKQATTLMEIVKTASGLLTTKARMDKPKDPAALPAVEEQVRMLTQTGPFGMFTSATRTVRVSEPPRLADPSRVLDIGTDET